MLNVSFPVPVVIKLGCVTVGWHTVKAMDATYLVANLCIPYPLLYIIRSSRVFSFNSPVLIYK